jgi:histidinol phosphatase-like enzyme
MLTADWSTAVYVGDAAGRKGDHSNTDYTMALNAGIKFVTPEVGVCVHEVRLLTARSTSLAGHQHTQTLPSHSDQEVSKILTLVRAPDSLSANSVPLVVPSNTPITRDTKELVIFVGPP